MTQEHDKVIKLVQSSTRNILGNYRERVESLRECSEDVKLLIREGYDPEIAEYSGATFWDYRRYLFSCYRWYKKPRRSARDGDFLCWGLRVHK